MHHDLFPSESIEHEVLLHCQKLQKINKVLAKGTGSRLPMKRAGWCMPVHDRNLLSLAYFNSVHQLFFFVGCLYLHLLKECKSQLGQ